MPAATPGPTGSSEPGPERATSRALPRTVVLLGATSFLTDVGTEMIFPLLPAFVVTLGAGPAFLGLVEGVADAIASFLKLAAGRWSDRTGRRKPLVMVGYGLASAVRPLMALAVAPWHVLVVRVSDRIGKGLRSAPRDALIALSVDDARAGRAFGFHRAMDHAGAVVGPLLAAGLLALDVPLRWVFAAAVVPGALAVLCVSLVREAPAAAATTPVSATREPAPAPERLPPRLLGFLAIVGLFSLAASSDAFLLMRARALGMSAAEVAGLWAAFHVVKASSTWWGGALADRVPRVHLIVLGWAIYAVSYLGFALATSQVAVVALFLFYALYHGMSEPAEKAMVRQLAPPGLQGRAFGAFHFVVGAAAVPAGLLSGWLWEAQGAPFALAVGAALAGVASVALAAWARQGRAGRTPGRHP